MEHNSFLKEEINPSMDQQDTCCEHQWRIDVEKIVYERGSLQRRESFSVCIFRVPKFLIDMNPKAYVPQVVSLGPLHWKTVSTQMRHHKKEAVRKMFGSPDGNSIHSVVVEEIVKLEEEIRSCYDEVIECGRTTLVSMMILDGCFILEFFTTIFCKAYPSEGVNYESISFFAGNKIEFLRGYMVLRDIMMLENQIPLCVLVKLLQLKLKSSEEDARQELCDLAYPCLMSKASPFKFPHHTETLKNLEAELKPQELMEKSNTLLDFWRLCMESFLTAGQTGDCSLPAGLDADDGRRRTGPLQDVTHKAPGLDPRTNRATPEQLTVRPSLGDPRFSVLCSTCIPRCPVPCADLDNPIPCCPVACAALDYPSSEVWSGKEGMSESAWGFEDVKGAALDNSIPGPSGEFEMLQLEPSPHEPVPGAALDHPSPVVKGAALDNPIPRFIFEKRRLKPPPHDPSVHGPVHELVVHREALHKPVPLSASDNAIASILPARSLKIAGIEIKACKRDKLNEIRFIKKGLCGATFLLPKLLVTDTTEIVIRNLLALEECRASPQNPISRYIQLMDMLIDGGEDVCLLIKNGVIDNYLGSEEEIAALFNSLCKGISVKHSPKFDAVLKQVKEYHDGKWNVVIAEFVQKHFSSPCVILAFVASVLIVVMTAVQTGYTVYSAYNK